MNLTIVTLGAQAYIVIDRHSGQTAFVDPGDSSAVLSCFASICKHFEGISADTDKEPVEYSDDPSLQEFVGALCAAPNLVGVMCTHKVDFKMNCLKNLTVLTILQHMDHAGGNRSLRRFKSNLTIWGGWTDKVAAVTHPLRHGDDFHIGKTRVEVYETPCHTKGHVIFRCEHTKSSGEGGSRELRDGPPTSAAIFTGDTCMHPSQTLLYLIY